MLSELKDHASDLLSMVTRRDFLKLTGFSGMSLSGKIKATNGLQGFRVELSV